MHMKESKGQLCALHLLHFSRTNRCENLPMCGPSGCFVASFFCGGRDPYDKYASKAAVMRAIFQGERPARPPATSCRSLWKAAGPMIPKKEHPSLS